MVVWEPPFVNYSLIFYIDCNNRLIPESWRKVTHKKKKKTNKKLIELYISNPNVKQRRNEIPFVSDKRLIQLFLIRQRQYNKTLPYLALFVFLYLRIICRRRFGVT